MIQIDMYNVKSKVNNIQNLPYGILNQICELCSYQRINGFKKESRQYLINLENGITYTGLVPYIISILKKNNIDYRLIDNRFKPDKHINYEIHADFIIRDYQQRIVDQVHSRDIIQACCSAGKALSMDSLLLTPDGYKKMKFIKVGDTVFDEDGKPTKVVNVYPQGLKSIVEVTFENDTTITCCEDHLWKFTKDKKNFCVDKIKNIHKGVYIPTVKPIQFCKKNVTLDPYLLGIILTTGYIEDNKLKLKFIKNEEKLNTLLKQNNCSLDNIISLFPFLIKDNKLIDYIPKNYLYNSIENRIKLANSIIDSVGIDEFLTISGNQFYKDACLLFQSLGYIVKIKSKITREYNYVLQIRKDDFIKIRSIRFFDKKIAMQCIAVDSPKHTYLCNNCIVTHNTFIMANIIKKFGVNTTILTSISSLAVQLKNELSNFLGRKVGICTGKYIDISNANVIVGTPQSLLNNKNVLEKAEALFVDECHLLPAKLMFDTACSCKNAYYRIGLSASPWRDDGADALLTAAINIRNPHKSILSSELIEKQIIVPVNITYYKCPSTLTYPTNRYDVIYKNDIINNNYRNSLIVETVKKHNDKSILILFKSIKHGQILLNLLREKIKNENFYYKGYKLNTIMLCDGNDSIEFREIVFDAVRNEKVKVLLGSTIADTGLSINNLSVLILAGGGKSSTRAFQRVGRIQRKYPGKNVAYVYDFWDEHPTLNKHSRLRYQLMSIEKKFVQNIVSGLINNE